MARPLTPSVSEKPSPVRPSDTARSLREAVFGSVDPRVVRLKIRSSQVDARRTFDVLSRALAYSAADVAKLIDVSPRTLSRRLSEKKALEPREADRAYRLSRIIDLANELIGDSEKANRWLRSPHAALGGDIPLELLDTQIGAESVERSLYAIAYGAPA